MIRLLFTSGRGPGECRIALARTLAVFAGEAEAAGLSLDLATGRDPDGLGPASAIAVLEGAGADAFAATWTGSILWVAQSPIRPHHKRKNWYIGISTIDARAPAVPTALDPADVRFEAFRAGGAGGQHQNTTDSAIRAVHLPTGLAVVAREARSQHRNKALALKRLSEHLALVDSLAGAADARRIQAGHDRLERGRPARVFEGEAFKPRRVARR
jgi:peptide chain release factor